MQKSKNYDAKRIILTKIINTFQYEEANTIDKGGYNVIDNPPSGSPEMKSISTWVSSEVPPHFTGRTGPRNEHI